MCDYETQDELSSAYFKLDQILEICRQYQEQCKIEGVCIDVRLCSTCFLGSAQEMAEEIIEIINQ